MRRQSKSLIDLHCPWVHGEYEERVFQVYGQNPVASAAQIRFGDILEKCQTGSLDYRRAQDFAWNFRWNSNSNYKSGCGIRSWAMQELEKTRLVTTFEIPFSKANAKTVDAASARAFGRDLAEALARFLKAEPEVMCLKKEG